ISFKDHYGDDGSVLANTIEGKMRTPGAQPTDPPLETDVAGSQVLFTNAEDWQRSDKIEQAALVIGVFSGIIGLLQAANTLRRALAQRPAAEQVQQARNNMNGVAMAVANRQEPDAGIWNAVVQEWRIDL